MNLDALTCTCLYTDPAVEWLLGGELHPGGRQSTRRALDMIEVSDRDRLLDVGCAKGESALLAAEELGCEVTGVDPDPEGVEAACRSAADRGLAAKFEHGAAEDLPFGDDSFDALICECALSVCADQSLAASEFSRVLRPGGRIAISDVVADTGRLPVELREPLAQVVCIGGALAAGGYEELLDRAGFRITGVISLDDDAAGLAEKVVDRLRGARILGFDGAEEALVLAGRAREAIADGRLGYAIMTGVT